jgi:diacylglycerol kinase family enzyme
VYTYAALRTLAGWRPATFTVTTVGPDGVRGEPEAMTGWSVAAANGAYYGGGMRYAPGARLDDGLLELVLAERTSKRHFLTLLPKVFSGGHVDDPHVAVRRVRGVRVDADRPFQVYADGDPLCDLPADICVLPGALRLIGPDPTA